VNPQFEWGGGGFASTPEDLARWGQLWYTGPVYGHGGFFPGYLTEMRLHAATGIAVAVMTNTSDARLVGTALGAIAEALAARVQP